MFLHVVTADIPERLPSGKDNTMTEPAAGITLLIIIAALIPLYAIPVIGTINIIRDYLKTRKEPTK